ncbi:hypothetical protein M409DRAFT_53613 [Zasmidium cellare ATCC 36951]|uniref:Rhodopsin domain-containing protein n=1 Tax=Zasmidium cellare ATCC 36951 TaxID=1080233 RepID=A0A6A6CM76_ZASCE|nr:uncharacterized protein M409DRAFT_53613 [Zasmidium cellare ATCC 36951]KAF2168337.1 hypothetical protein M409DRAFT_53613 [Zasmidium cellare ATCC 36951]
MATPTTQTYTFSPVTSTDRAGTVWVASILSLMFSVLTLATRLQIKYHTLGLDDLFIAAATLVAVGQYIAIYIGLDAGVGRSSTLLTEEYAAHLGVSVLVSEVLFIVAVMLSKLSVVFFMRRLATYRSLAWWCCDVAVVGTVVWGVGSAVGVSVGCGMGRVLVGERRCDGELLRWSLTLTLSATLELLYVLLSLLLVSPLQMRLHIKTTVVLAFSFRLLCAVLAALHTLWIAKYVSSPDPGLAIADVLVWQQVGLGYSLIATTIPTLKNFVRGYNRAMGWEPSSSGEKKRGLFVGGGYNLGSLVRSDRSRSQPDSGGSGQRRGISRSGGGRSRPSEGELQLGPAAGDYRVGAFHDSTTGSGGGRGKGKERRDSGDSADPIIRRQISVTVETERASSFRQESLGAV